MANYQTLQCTIHGIRWETPDGEQVECPMCMREELRTVQQKMKQAIDDRDLLLKAIQIKLSTIPEDGLR